MQVTYQATDFCSRFKVTLKMQGFGECIFPLEVKFDKELVNLADKQHPYINTYTNDTTHPDSHWGREKLVTAITEAADAFGRELETGRFGEVTDEQKKLQVNDLSLPWGGMFKSYGEMKGISHGNHRWGQNVDISYQRMLSIQRIWFERTAKELFDTADRHKKGTSKRTLSLFCFYINNLKFSQNPAGQSTYFHRSKKYLNPTQIFHSLYHHGQWEEV